MMCNVDQEIECQKCAGRMYWDDFSTPKRKNVPVWVCMNCKRVVRPPK